MVLPDPDKLRQVLEVARDCGATRFRCGGIDVTFAQAEREDAAAADLDEDLPPLAKEPEFGNGVDPVVSANFKSNKDA